MLRIFNKNKNLTKNNTKIVQANEKKSLIEAMKPLFGKGYTMYGTFEVMIIPSTMPTQLLNSNETKPEETLPLKLSH